jgi:uncharacterized protein
MIEIKLVKDVDMKGATLIEGFPGIGLVGPMAVSYIIDKLNMEYVGYIECEEFPPLVSIHNGQPLPPVRIYYSSKKKIVAMFAEFAIPVSLASPLAEKIYAMFKSNDMKDIISIGGMPSKNMPDNSVVYAITSTKEAQEKAENEGLKPVIEGVSTGVSARLILLSALDSILNITILVPVDPSIINPKCAEFAINSINKILKLNIDVTELENEAKEVDAKIRELLKKSKEMQDTHRNSIGGSGTQSMYA